MKKAMENFIIRMAYQGYTPKAIAAYYQLTAVEVRSVLRMHQLEGRGYKKKPSRKEDELANARELMLKAGYDPAVVEANFPGEKPPELG